MPIRIVCLVLMVVLSADTLLATVGTGADCGAACDCCAPANHEPALTGLDHPPTATGCCPSTATPSCHVTGKTDPGQPLAVVQSVHPSAGRHLLHPTGADLSTPVAAPRSSGSAWIDTNPGISPPPIYLQACRLIC